MSGRYAQGTEVDSGRSRAEIERTVTRYGATGFAYGWQQDRAIIEFAMEGRRVRFVVPLPAKDDDEFRLTPSGKWERSQAEQLRAWEQACRQRWRALNLVVKAKLEAVESGITSFEEEFLAHTVLPDGGTVGEWAVPQVERAYQLGVMPTMLPALEASR